MIFIRPESPSPSVTLLSLAPFLRDRTPVVMFIPPLSPSAPSRTSLNALPPSKDIVSVALIVMFPEFPSPRVLALSKAPLVTESDLPEISMLPP